MEEFMGVGGNRSDICRAALSKAFSLSTRASAKGCSCSRKAEMPPTKPTAFLRIVAVLRQQAEFMVQSFIWGSSDSTFSLYCFYVTFLNIYDHRKCLRGPNSPASAQHLPLATRKFP
ncbi:hypothetical protein E2C01_034171 [Portunus trituberculatus]|uniref:Uncharacterized protein n=1 Tax=Portunus trituberculatus TaxID=210409 RepID=A0A5B7F5V7_PORTR|nr:hypothetical protein [Portunus trituberculatus]